MTYNALHLLNTLDTVLLNEVPFYNINSRPVFFTLYLLEQIIDRSSSHLLEMIFSIGCNSIIISGSNQIIVLVIHCNLLWNQIMIFFGNLCNIKLIAKCSGKCHMPPCLKWSDSSHGMIRTIRYMSPHGRKWIKQ